MHLTADSTGEAGFSVVELLVALSLSLLLGLVATEHFGFAASAARVQPAAVDLAGRARAAADLVASDLMMAGAGVEHGPAAGGLVGVLPVVLPRRIGRVAPDPPTVAVANRITVAFAPYGALAGVLRSPLVGATPPVDIDPSPPCGAVSPPCGWPDGATLVVFDGRERHDYYLLAAPVGATPLLAPRQPNPGFPYGAGAMVTPVETHTYYHDAARHQLRHYDGHASDVPAIDNVMSLAFSYEGERTPPSRPKPPVGESNCLYDDAGVRWPWIQPLPGAIGGLVDLPLGTLVDGPWCGTGDNRFDVDLLRVRRIRMTMTLQAADDLRLRSGLFFAPGSSASARRMVSDLSITIDITPRNLNAGR